MYMKSSPTQFLVFIISDLWAFGSRNQREMFDYLTVHHQKSQKNLFYYLVTHQIYLENV